MNLLEDMWVSWCDDGVIIVCEREQCMVAGNWWYQVIDSPYRLQPVDLLRAMKEHALACHWKAVA